MEMMVFDVMGKFASFKKFYTNSSSMSYIFPPRTTIEGIIASIMGYDFDSYYDKFSFKKSLISVSLKSEIRTYIGTLNYIKIINFGAYNNMFKKKGYGYTQIPFEMILPENFSNNIVFRIYFKSDDSIMHELEDKIKNKRPVYPISLGNADMLGTVNFVANAEISKINNENEYISVVSPSPLKYIKGICMADDIHIQRDIFPVSFDDNRYPQTMEYIFEREGKKYKIKTDKTVLNIKYNDINENILFPEVASNEFLFT